MDVLNKIKKILIRPWFANFTSIVFQFLYMIILVRLANLSLIGKLYYLLVFPSALACLTTIGIPTYILRSDKSTYAKRGLFTSLLLYILSLPVFIIVLFIFNIPNEFGILMVGILCLEALFMTIMNTLNSILVAKNKYFELFLANSLSGFLKMASTPLLLLLGVNEYTIFIPTMLFSFSRSILYVIFALPYELKLIPISELFPYIGASFVGNIFGGIDIIFLRIFANYEAIALYEYALKVIYTYQGILDSEMNAIYKSKKHSNLLRFGLPIVITIIFATVLLGVSIILFNIPNDWNILILYVAIYELLLFGRFFMIIIPLYRKCIIYNPKIITISTTIASILNIVLNLILGLLSFGALGIALATCISNIAVTIIPYILKKKDKLTII